jgi:ribosome maturation factor RimP
MAANSPRSTPRETTSPATGTSPEALADAVREVISQSIDDAGLYLDDVRITRAGSRAQVRVAVDLPESEIGSLDSDALTSVSRAISAALDADDVVPGAYVLEVTTPGTSRPLTTPRHFRRARTRIVRLQMLDKASPEMTGRLMDVVGDEDVMLVMDGGDEVALSAVRRGKIEVELKRPEAEDASHEDDQNETKD